MKASEIKAILGTAVASIQSNQTAVSPEFIDSLRTDLPRLHVIADTAAPAIGWSTAQYETNVNQIGGMVNFQQQLVNGGLGAQLLSILTAIMSSPLLLQFLSLILKLVITPTPSSQKGS